MTETAKKEDRVAKQSDEPWTVLRLLEWTTQFFKSRGSESARLDAEVLLAAAKDCERIALYTSFSEVPGEDVLAAFREMVRRRGQGVPVSQLVGHKEFYSIKFRVNEHTLIPRPETEHLVIQAIDCLRAMELSDRPAQVADIGTGSGVIAISIAKQLPNTRITATDISGDALEIAKWNADKIEVADRIEFHQCDLLGDVREPALFDVICSNPPYVSEEEFEELDQSVSQHEPTTALVSGPKGTEIIERILTETIDRLNPGGWMIIELSPMIAAECERLASQTGSFQNVAIHKDLAKHDRLLVAQKKAA